MDYNFYSAVLWFFSSTLMIKAVGVTSLGLALLAALLRFRG